MFATLKKTFRSLAVGASLVLALGSMAVAGAAQAGAAQTGRNVYAVTTSGNLITFNSATPGTTIATVALSGLPEGDEIVGIDVRPANGQLLALTANSRLYIINPSTGALTAIGSAAFTPALSGSSFGFDFNPTVDRIRLTSDARQDLRLNPINGAVAAVDGTLTYAASDRNAATTPVIVASGYTNNFGNSTSTVLYNIDAANDTFVVQNPPNNGTLVTVGSLGVDAGLNTSLDIAQDALGSDAAYASIGSGFYRINIANGAATFIGNIAGGPVTGIALTGSTAVASSATPLCANFDGSTSAIVRASFAGGEQVFCRVLYENRNPVSGTAGAQIGVASVLSAGVIQAVDVFRVSGGVGVNGPLAAPAQICLLGTGNLIFLDASQSPRTPQTLTTSMDDGYTCGFVTNTGTVVLTAN